MIRAPRTTRERIVVPRGASGRAPDKESFHLRVDVVVGMHIMQKKPFENRDAVLEALSRADPERKEWNRQRLDYQVNRIIQEEQKKKALEESKKRPATRSPAVSPFNGQYQEGFPVDGRIGHIDHLGLNLQGMDLDEPPANAPPPANPRGGRPVGTTIAASKELKKINAALFDSATRAWALAKAGTEAPERGALLAMLTRKAETYRSLYPSLSITTPNVKAISHRVQRHAAAPEKHSLESHGRGPVPILARLEDLLVAWIEELATYGMYSSTKELRYKMADLMRGTPRGEQFTIAAAMVLPTHPPLKIKSRSYLLNLLTPLLITAPSPPTSSPPFLSHIHVFRVEVRRRIAAGSW